MTSMTQVKRVSHVCARVSVEGCGFEVEVAGLGEGMAVEFGGARFLRRGRMDKARIGRSVKKPII